MRYFFELVRTKFINKWNNFRDEFIESPTPYAVVIFLLLNLALFVTLSDFIFRISAESLEGFEGLNDPYDYDNTHGNTITGNVTDDINLNVDNRTVMNLVDQDTIRNDNNRIEDHVCAENLIYDSDRLFHKLGQWRWDLNEEYFNNFLSNNRYLIAAKIILDKNYFEEFIHDLIYWIKLQGGSTLKDVSNMDILTFFDEFGDKVKVRNENAFEISIVKYDLNNVGNTEAKDFCFDYHIHPDQTCNIDYRINKLGFKYKRCFETWYDCRISLDQYYYNTLFGYQLEFRDS